MIDYKDQHPESTSVEFAIAWKELDTVSKKVCNSLVTSISALLIQYYPYSAMSSCKRRPRRQREKVSISRLLATSA